MLSGVDVSFWNGNLDWTKLVKSGVEFAFIKCSDRDQSGLFLDKKFIQNWENTRGILPRGAYHYLQPGDPVKQAEYFWYQVRSDMGELPLVCDAEQRGITAQDIQFFMTRLQGLSGRKPMLYTSPGFWQTMYSPGWGMDYYLWQAQYPAYLQKRYSWPQFMYPWAKWHFWQYYTEAKLPGMANLSDKIDINWFNGSKAEMLSLVNG